jgi:hypothetical protein
MVPFRDFRTFHSCLILQRNYLFNLKIYAHASHHHHHRRLHAID